MADKSKKAPGQFTHWARPRWLRMYEYNYEYGESYYRNQVQYVSTSSVASDTASYIDSRRAYLARRAGAPPPRAKSFIERWAADPFYGRGFTSSSSAANARSSRSTSRAVSASSNYASNSLLSQIRSARESTSSVLAESSSVQQELRARRARSVEARASSIAANYGYGSDDCLMRSSALDANAAAAATVAQQRAIRAQSVAAVSSAELNYSRQSRATSVQRASSVQRSTSIERSSVSSSQQAERASAQRYSDESFQYNYPVWSSFACSANTCATKKGNVEDRRFVMGNKYIDAAALGGFDVLYDPSAYSKTRTLLKRLSEERDIVSEYRAESVARSSAKRETESQVRQSSSRLAYKYNTIY